MRRGRRLRPDWDGLQECDAAHSQVNRTDDEEDAPRPELKARIIRLIQKCSPDDCAEKRHDHDPEGIAGRNARRCCQRSIVNDFQSVAERLGHGLGRDDSVP